jgi:hypothetical protein
LLQVNTSTLATRSDKAVDTINAALAALRALLASLNRADEKELPSLLRRRARSSKQLSEAELEDLATQADKFRARQRRLNQFKLPFYGKLDWSYVKARVSCALLILCHLVSQFIITCHRLTPEPRLDGDPSANLPSA